SAGDRLRARRIALGLSQAMLARRAGVSVATVSRVETGATATAGDRIVRIEDALDREC
ncbi:MAG: helix-turn-helix transcriptional regulator, partial [Alphaproteobacteria bacterium]|nr:helix-turn-helix transcriptional regulator [Alphaproteobacteria bacterium]